MNHFEHYSYNNNRARASKKKSAVGFLCRAYAQAAGSRIDCSRWNFLLAEGCRFGKLIS